MSKDTKNPWHICDDCLEPLANKIAGLAKRFHIPFDFTKLDENAAEYRQIQEESGYCNDRLTKENRIRRDWILKHLSAQKEPPRPIELDWLYADYKIELATDYLKFNVSVDYANDFKRTLLNVQTRFSALDFKACQIMNGDLGKESTVQIRCAIQRLIARHYELLREQFPDHESHPERDELPEELQAFEIEILDEYTTIQQELSNTAAYLRNVSALVRSKLKPAKVRGKATDAGKAYKRTAKDATYDAYKKSGLSPEQYAAREHLDPEQVRRDCEAVKRKRNRYRVSR